MDGELLLERRGSSPARYRTAQDALSQVRDRRAELRYALADRGGIAENPEWTDSVRRVLVICSASRSGSSLLVRLITRLPKFYSFIGETATFLRLHGLAGVGEDSDDVFDDAAFTPTVRANLSVDLGNDLIASYRPSLDLSDRQIWLEYVSRLVLRLAVQWPGLTPKLIQAFELMVLDEGGALHRAARQSEQKFYLAATTFLQERQCIDLSLAHYDLGRPRESHNDADPPDDGMFVEEPPFEVVPFCPVPSAEDIEDGCLVLKCPADSYRLHWIAKLFPAAKVHYLHLVRNPAASVNGLIDGWLSNAFYSRRVERDLRIGGYSDIRKGGDRWWKFDLPPDWRPMSETPLGHVCAFQWASNNAALLAHAGSSGPQAVRVPYDALLAAQTRQSLLTRVAEAVGLECPALDAGSLPLPLVQITALPERGRWRARESQVLDALRSVAGVRDVAQALGYPLREHQLWS